MIEEYEASGAWASKTDWFWTALGCRAYGVIPGESMVLIVPALIFWWSAYFWMFMALIVAFFITLFVCKKAMPEFFRWIRRLIIGDVRLVRSARLGAERFIRGDDFC